MDCRIPGDPALRLDALLKPEVDEHDHWLRMANKILIAPSGAADAERLGRHERLVPLVAPWIARNENIRSATPEVAAYPGSRGCITVKRLRISTAGTRRTRI